MEELKHELEKLSKTYVDTPEKEEKILIPFIKNQKVVRTFSERTEKTPAHYPGTAMDKRQV